MKRFLLLLTLLLSLTATAQEKKDSFWSDLTDFLDLREQKNYAKFDSTYIGRYPYHWDARLFYKSAGMYFYTIGESEVLLSTGMNHRVGVGLSYRGLGLSYSRAIGKKLNLDLGIESYTRHFCLEYALRLTTGLSGSVITPGKPNMTVDDLILGESCLNLFYSFNSRFSYAAAMKQSQIQRRSAGSLIASLSWNVWDIVEFANFDEDDDEDMRDLILGLFAANTFYNRISVGAGYGYNWVLGREHWLLHGSAVPMWTVYDASTVRENGQKTYKAYPNGWISISASFRAGIYYRWGDRWSAGVSGVMNIMSSRNHLSPKADNYRRFGAHDWQMRFNLTFRF